MSIILEVANETNWLPFYTFTLQATPKAGTVGRYNKIPEYPIPLILDRHFLAVIVNHDPNPNEWIRGGKFKQRLNASLVTGGVFNTAALSVHNVTLDEINIIQVPKFSEYYALSYAPPKYFKKVTGTVYKYLPDVVDDLAIAVAGLQVAIDLLHENIEQLSLGGSL